MIESWPEAGALVGSIGIVVGGAFAAFHGNNKKETEVNAKLIDNNAQIIRILDRLSLLAEHRDTRTEELHRDTQSRIAQAASTHDRKLDEVTKNQRDILEAVERGLSRLKTA